MSRLKSPVIKMLGIQLLEVTLHAYSIIETTDRRGIHYKGTESQQYEFYTIQLHMNSLQEQILSLLIRCFFTAIKTPPLAMGLPLFLSRRKIS